MKPAARRRGAPAATSAALQGPANVADAPPPPDLPAVLEACPAEPEGSAGVRPAYRKVGSDQTIELLFDGMLRDMAYGDREIAFNIHADRYCVAQIHDIEARTGLEPVTC